MSKTKEEPNKLKEEIESVNERLQELTPGELEKVTGGCGAAHAIRVQQKVNLTDAVVTWQGKTAGVEITHEQVSQVQR